MSYIVYPKGETNDVYDELGSSFTVKNFVKINTLKENNCVYDSFLMSMYRNYQDQRSPEKCKLIRNNFINQFKGYLISESNTEKEVIYSKLLEAFEMTNYTEKYHLKPLNDEDEFDIMDIGIFKKTSQITSKGFRLFCEKSKDYFKGNSNFFDKVSKNFLKEIIEQKIVKKEFSERFEDEEENRGEIKEILDFMCRKENSLDILNLFSIVNINDCRDQDLVLRLFSEVLGINIFLCRSWSSEISVLKLYQRDEYNPYIIIFKIEGKVSYTGLEKSTMYECGGIKYDKGIKTILNPEKDKNAIKDLKKILENDIDSYYRDKYTKYLSKLDQKSDLKNIEDYYDDEEGSSSEDEEVLRESESSSSEEEEEKEDYSVPDFVKKYSKLELESLMNMFVDEEYDYSTVTKKSLEIQYSSYLRSNDN